MYLLKEIHFLIRSVCWHNSSCDSYVFWSHRVFKIGVSCVLLHTESKKKEFAAQSPLWMSDELEFWPERGEPLPQFALLAALYSELIAVTVNGQLYQWKWNEAEPYRHSEVCIHYSLKLRIAAQNV